MVLKGLLILLGRPLNSIGYRILSKYIRMCITSVNLRTNDFMLLINSETLLIIVTLTTLGALF